MYTAHAHFQIQWKPKKAKRKKKKVFMNLGNYPISICLCFLISLFRRPPTPPLLSATPFAVFPRGNPHLHLLKLCNSTRYGDPTRMIEPVNILGLFQQLPKQRVIEVDYRHQIPLRVVMRFPHVHSQVSLRHTHRFRLHRIMTHRHVTRLGRTEFLGSPSEIPSQGQNFRHGIAFSPRRVQELVPNWLPSSLSDNPFVDLHQLPSQLETSGFFHASLNQFEMGLLYLS